MKATFELPFEMPSLEEYDAALQSAGRLVFVDDPTTGERFVVCGVPVSALRKAKPKPPPPPPHLHDRLDAGGWPDAADLARRMERRINEARRFDLMPVPPPPNDLAAILDRLDARGDELAKEAAARIRLLDDQARDIARLRHKDARNSWAVSVSRHDERSRESTTANEPAIPEPAVHTAETPPFAPQPPRRGRPSLSTEGA